MSPSHEVFDIAAIYRHKFEGIFDMHGVRTGSPEDLAGLVTRLETDRYFAMDFREMAQSAARLGGGDSKAEICEMVVRCVGGPAAQDTDPGAEELRREFAADTASERQASDTGAEEIQAAEPMQCDQPAEEGSNGANERLRLVSESDESLASPAEMQAGELPAHRVDANEAAEEIAGGPAYGRSQQLDDLLSRLEIDNNSLRLHLDTIDHRVSRIEPHLEDLTSQVALSSGRIAEDSARKGVQAGDAGHFDVGDQPAAVAEPGQPMAREGFTRATNRAAARHPVQADRRRRLMTLAAVLLAVLCVFALTWSLLRRPRGPAAQDVGLNPVSGTPAGAAAGPTAAGSAVTGGAARETQRLNPEAVPGNTQARAGMHSHSADREPAGHFGGDGPATQTQAQRSVGAAPGGAAGLEGSATTTGEEGTAGENTAGVNTTGRLSRPGVANSEAASPVAGGVAAGSQSQRSAAGRKSFRHPSSRPPGRAAGWGISVSSGVMASNLIRSVPANYPKLARLAHIQGVVVMQVFVSKDGIVDHINAVKGHRLLRGAAENAVRQWRYRPYLLNGRAVEVATVVTVDFTLGK